MRGRGGWLPGLLAAVLAVLAALVAIPLTVVGGYFPVAVTGHRVAWVASLAGILVVIGALAWLAAQPGRRQGTRLLGVPLVAGWVDRGELADLVAALTASGGATVALTTGLTGAGGFGKTTLAAKACQDQRVLDWFRGGIVWITVGRDTNGAALAAKISEVIADLGASGPAFTSLEHAASALTAALAGRGRTLLVADDVWTAAQLRPFAVAGQSYRLLVTTRRPAVLHGIPARQITVDALPTGAARRLLTRDMTVPMAPRLEGELVALTGGWSLLLSLVNRRLADDVQRRAGIDAAAELAVRRLRQGGPTALDVADSGMREDAVAATVGYSLEPLDVADRQRFLELGIFAEDAEVPVAVAAMLWQETTGLGEAASHSLCDRLDGLSLLALAWAGPVRVIVVHDVIRDYARHQLGPAGQLVAHTALVAAARQVTKLPTADGTALGGGRGLSVEDGGTQWWRLPRTADHGYLWQYLTYHLRAAGLDAELDQACTDLRFLAVKLESSGPAAVETDLARSASPLAGRLRRIIAQDADLLSPLQPSGALTTTLTTRLSGTPELAGQMPALRSCLHVWTAWPAWPAPDLPPHTLLRTITGHIGAVSAVAIAPDGTWLATASDDGTARTWNADGTPRTTLTGHTGAVSAVAIAPDGTWLATASDDGTARTWNADGTPRATLTGHTGAVNAVAIAPDGTWLATASDDGTARTWNTDGTPRATLTGHTRTGDRGRDRPRRNLARHRRHRQDGPDLEHRRHPPRHPHRPQRRGERGGDRPRRDLARHRQRRRDGPDLEHRRHPPRHPHRPHQPGDRGGDRPRRNMARHRRHRQDSPDLEHRRNPPRHPHRPQRRGERGRDRPRRNLARHRQQRRHRPDLEHRRNPPRHPHRPPARGVRGRDRPRRDLARHRRRRLDSPDLGRRRNPPGRGNTGWRIDLRLRVVT